MKLIKHFTQKRKKLYLKLAVFALFIVAILGYSFEKKKMPIRVSFETKGGGIIFDHHFHVSLKDSKCKDNILFYANGSKIN